MATGRGGGHERKARCAGMDRVRRFGVQKRKFTQLKFWKYGRFLLVAASLYMNDVFAKRGKRHEELTLLLYLNTSKNPKFSYDVYDCFDLDKTDE